jgi:lipopolysaccharide/colanic/teichoic acid biosynthesis glycosyltransferase
MQVALNKDSLRMVDTAETNILLEKIRALMVEPSVKPTVHRTTTYIFIKSIYDRVLAFIGLVGLSPFMFLIALVIRLDTPGHSLYLREQIGEKGRRFTAYKFRTMYEDSDHKIYHSYLVKYVQNNEPYKTDENNQPVYKVVDDPRVTRIGALLRKTNLDELPQLINVLKGEMSFVGPRPDVPFAVAMYKNWQLKRLAVKPGMTGLWQVQGRKNLSFKHMVHLDLIYIRRQSLLLDLVILIRTVGVVLSRDGSQ